MIGHEGEKRSQWQHLRRRHHRRSAKVPTGATSAGRRAEGDIVDDDDPVQSAGREIAAAARAVATGVAVAARAKVERQAERRFEEARRLEARGRVSGAWSGVERRDRPHDVVEAEVEQELARG
jgi:hypothetical protein